MKHHIVCFCLCFQINAFTQNIVPNPGFESFTNLPESFNESPEAYTRCVNNWKVPNRTTPDYIAPGFFGGKLFGISHGGFGMTGLDIASSWAECIYAELKTEMEANTTYLIEFWVKRPDGDFQKSEGADSDCLPGFVSPNFGILLSDTLQTSRNKEFIIGTPQLSAGERLWVAKEWLKISGFFTTDKNYRYIYVGQFRPEGESGPMAASRYVLIDDILIRKLNISDQFGNSAASGAGTIIPLDQVFFETGKSELEDRSHASLDTLAAFLSTSAIQIRINGHTDNEGDALHNQLLSKERAKAVYAYLISKGIDKNRLSWEGFGESKPKTENTTEAGRQKNRRVEFEILKK